MAGKPKKKRRFKIWSTLLIMFLMCILTAVVIVGGYVLKIAETVPDFDDSSFYSSETSFIYDANGNLMHTLYDENRVYVTGADIPDFLFDILVASEDARFYDHFGVDVIRIFGSLWRNIKSGDLTGQGASTITMQIARNAILNNLEKELDRKVQEALLAMRIEREYSKEEILCFYLNEVHFGNGCNGIQAAAKFYFDKDVSELTLGEAAMLIGILPAPASYNPYASMPKATDRRDIALNSLMKYDESYTEAALAAKQEDIIVAEGSREAISSYNYPWFTDYVISQAEKILANERYSSSLLYTGGLKIYTTMDPFIQETMQDAYTNPEFFPASTTGDIVESSMVIIDQHTGEIKGLVGGREHLTKRAFNRATSLRRQPGSTIKPIMVYAPALEAGYSPASVVNDVFTNFGTTQQPYTPSNMDGTQRGLISMRNALRNSVNIPAVRFLELIGTNTGLNFANSLGLPLEKEPPYLPIALGGLTYGVSPLEMAGAYAAFANSGIYTEPYCIYLIEDSKGNIIYKHKNYQKIVMSEITAYLMTDMLQTVTTSGTGTAARMNRPVASKTGTTELPTDLPEYKNLKGNKDAWFAAYTPELTGVIWMGYDKARDAAGNLQYLERVYGGGLAARLWKEIMEIVLKDVPVSAFPDPGGWTTVEIDTKSGLLPSNLTPTEYIGKEKFAAANVPTEVSDIWALIDIDPETGKRATAYCPKVEKKVMIDWLPENPPGRTSDAALYAPSGYCELHGAPDPTAESVLICTDPSHAGKYYLANVAGFGYTGGCPAETVTTMVLGAAYRPTEHCPLETHQTITAIVIPPEEQENNTVEGLVPTLSAPSSLTGEVVQKDGVTNNYLRWVDSINDPQKTMYVIEKITNGDISTRELIKTYGISYYDSDITAGNVYQYRVYAFVVSANAVSNWTDAVFLNP